MTELSTVKGTRLHRRGTSRDGTAYPSTFKPTFITSGGVAESPVTPVGLESLRIEQIDDVVTELTGDGHILPSPFTKGDLYQNAVNGGISVWKPSVKERFTARILDRLNYEWDAMSGRFVPIIGEQLVEDIKYAASTITSTFHPGLPQSLRSRINKWCDRHGLDSFENETVQVIVARQAVLTWFLKGTLYEWYHRRGVVPPRSMADRQAFREARELTGDPAFDEIVLDHLADRADEAALTAVSDHRARLLYSVQPAEDIGRVYEALTPKEYRQSLGQFRTPPDLAEVMWTWACGGEERILDPGLGAGGLSSGFHPRWELSTEPEHVFGVDRSPLSILLGTAALTLAGQTHHTCIGDFLDFALDDLDDGVDSLVANPPFTRATELDSAYVRKINTQVEREIDLDISEKAPLYVYFLCHARSFLNEGGRMAVVTPQSWLSRRYGENVKRFLRDRFRIKALVQFDPEATSVFDTADETALLLFLEATDTDTPTGETRFLSVDESIDPGDLRDAINGAGQDDPQWGTVTTRPQTELDPTRNWQTVFDGDAIGTNGLVPLGILSECHRGTTTGAARFFCLSQETVDAYGIDESHLTRVIRRPGVVDGYDVTDSDWEELRQNGRPTWLLDPDVQPDVPDEFGAFAAQVQTGTDPETDSESAEGLIRYLRTAITEHGLDESSTFATRRYWYQPKRHPPADVIVPDSSRNGFPFLLNASGARNVHNFHGLHDVDLDVIELKALLAYLNSEFSAHLLDQETYTRQDGYESLGISTLREQPVIDPRELPDDLVTALAGAFDDLCTAARRNTGLDSATSRITRLLETELDLRLPDEEHLE